MLGFRGQALASLTGNDQTGAAEGGDGDGVNRLDRYILRQHMAALGFFLLIFTGVIWLTQAVRLIDTVIASGQSAATFVEFSLLVLPQVLVIVLPLSAIGAALYVLNKLYTDSELVVMMSSGLGPLALMRPIAIFGAIVGAMLAVVLIQLIPVAGTTLAERTRAIRSDLAQALLVERQFIHPSSGLTLFISDTEGGGQMEGLFLHDQRDPEQVVTYSAQHARFIRQGMEARLVMADGVALASGAGGGELNTVQFDQFVYDLSDLVAAEGARVKRPSEYPVRALLDPTPEMLATDRYTRGEYIAEAHYKISLPLLTVTYPMVALVTFLAGGYRRSGFGRRVIVAVGVAVLIQVLAFACEARVKQHPELWAMSYLPHLASLAYVGALLLWLNRGRRRGGSRSAAAPA
jgi:lipopolysaccharide export system permease protein